MLNGSMSSRRVLLSLMLLVSAPLLSACATMHAYPGTERPPEEVGTVVDTFGLIIFAGWSINIVSIDGQPVSELYGTFKVLPGTHTIGFTYYANFLGNQMIGFKPCYVTFEAEAGHRYRVDGEGSIDGTWYGWIRDETTGSRVQGTSRPESKEG